jgi:hypothetical protein
MLRTRALVVVLPTLLIALAWAGQPWKQKKPENWDKHDVDQILRASPWAQVITVAPSPTVFTSERPEVGRGTQIGSVNRDPGKDPLDIGSADARTWNPEGVFVLRWESSRTIRRALSRKAALQRGKTAASSEEELATEPDDYELVMVAESVVRLPDSEANTLASHTYLQGKLSGEQVHPDRVVFRPDPDSGRVVAVEFHFARRTSSGKPIVWANEETIEFFSQVGPRVFHAKFHPKQMDFGEGPDL